MQKPIRMSLLVLIIIIVALVYLIVIGVLMGASYGLRSNFFHQPAMQSSIHMQR
jgi:hypothetical protein